MNIGTATREITRQETAERAQLLRIDSYDIELDLTRGPEVFGSVSVIRFGCNETGATSYVDLIASTVHEVVLNGSAIDPAAAYADGRIALTDLTEQNELRVVADCAYTSDSTAMHRAVDSADGKVYLYTTMCAAEARKVFANFDQPDLKASFALHITAPAHWTVLSNQPTPPPSPIGADTAVWHFDPTPRISTYLTAVIAGDYELVHATHTTARGQEIPLGIACRASLASSLDASDIFETTAAGLDFYTQLFDADYPFAKYDQVFVPEFAGGAMENVACVTVSEQLLFRSKVTDLMYETRAGVILHEMAHMWFGNLVTMRWWEDLWLNESFAEFGGTLAQAECTRFADAWTTFAVAQKTWGYRQDQLPSTHPIAADVPTLSEAITNFDGISYAKGASVLKQLVAYVGREKFLIGIRDYFAEHAWGNATLADLLRALEKSSGIELAGWARAWLQTAGPNTLRSEFDVDVNGDFSTFTVRQEAPAEHPTLRPHRIAIGLYNRVDGALVRTHRVEVDIDGDRTDIPALLGLAQPDLILLNDDDLGYAIVRFDQRSLHTLMSSIGDFTDALARTICWSAVIDMASQVELSLPAFVRIVANGMGQEPSVAVLQILHLMTNRSVARAADPHWVSTGRELLATVALPLLLAAEPAGDHQLAWAQLLGWTAVTDEQLDLLAELLDGSANVAGLAIDTDLRWSFLRRLAATGRVGATEIDAELLRDATDAGNRQAAACLAAMPDATRKAEAWRKLAESDELGAEGVVAVAAGFATPEHADLLAPYVARYFEILPTIWSSRSDISRITLGTELFPHYAASPELLARIDDFLAEQERDPALVRLLVERRDVVERGLRALSLPA